jgi:integrase
MGRKTKKGEVGIFNDDGRFRLRWSFEGERFSFNLPFPYKRSNFKAAKIRACQIELEMLSGKFVPQNYRKSAKSIGQNIEGTSPDVSKLSYSPADLSPSVIASPLQDGTDQVVRQSLFPTLKSCLEFFNYWVKNIRSKKEERSNYYPDVRKLFSKWGGHTIDETPKLLGDPDWAASTFNSRLDCMHAFFEWLLLEEKIPRNPLAAVQRRKKTKDFSGKRDPMDENDLVRFLCAIRDNTFCHPSTTPANRHSHYFPFFLFLALTGVRPAEAIGLRVKHVDLEKGFVEISEAMARTTAGSHHAARIRKETKQGNTRYLPINEALLLILQIQIKDSKKDDLVFPSPKGLCIDDRMLARRVMSPVLKKLEIDEKVMYFFRHNFGTKSIDGGIVPTGTAYLMGHTTIETVMRNYVSVAKSTKQLPNIVKMESLHTNN